MKTQLDICESKYTTIVGLCYKSRDSLPPFTYSNIYFYMETVMRIIWSFMELSTPYMDGGADNLFTVAIAPKKQYCLSTRKHVL